MSFCLSFHQALPGPTGAHWLDNPSDVSCKDSTRQHPVDGPLLSCKQQVGVRVPPPASHRGRGADQRGRPQLSSSAKRRWDSPPPSDVDRSLW